ncbi:Protein purity of essence [Trichinella pseudospiralis]
MTNATYGERYHSAGYCDEASVKMPCFQRYCCYVEAVRVETDQSSFSLVVVTGCLRRIGSFPKSAFTTDQHTIFAIYIHLQPAGKQARTSACVVCIACCSLRGCVILSTLPLRCIPYGQWSRN